MTENRFKGAVYTLVSSFLLGLVFIFSRLAQKSMASGLFLFWWFAAALIWVPLILLLAQPDRRGWLSLLRKYWLFFLSYNVIEGVGNIFFFYLIRVINPSVVSFFYSLSPFVGAVIAYFYLRERLGLREWIGGSISVAGVVFITYVSPQVGLVHALYALAMTVLYSLNNVLVKKVVAEVPPLLITVMRIILLAVSFSLILALGGGFRLPSLMEAALIGAGTLCGPVFGMLTLFAALKHLRATYVFLLRNAQPFMVAAMAALFLSQPFTFKQLAGGLLIISGLSFMLLSQRMDRKSAAALPLSDPGE